jgi:DNA (cytosine-5)-methyltransferase 1
MEHKRPLFNSIEICAGAGGQALGLEAAGYESIALVELEAKACETLRLNRPHWRVIEGDVRAFSAQAFYQQVDLLAGGVPCPPFSIASKQLGEYDERDLFPEAIRLTEECLPKAVMLENVRGLLSPKFKAYQRSIVDAFHQMGYTVFWKVLQASDYGISQLRPRAVLVALRRIYASYFSWPAPYPTPPPTVGELLYPAMQSGGWEGAEEWRSIANGIAPTLVGGSKKHGGPDLGPTRARQAWEKLGVNGKGLADSPPGPGFEGLPKLTPAMTALLQGFPPTWQFVGRKTAAYRQIGNAFPPAVAEAVAHQIGLALQQISSTPPATPILTTEWTLF